MFQHRILELAILKHHFLEKFYNTLLLKGIGGFWGFFGGSKFYQKYCIAYSKFSKGSKLKEIVSKWPIIFVYLVWLANEISKIRSIFEVLSALVFTTTVVYNDVCLKLKITVTVVFEILYVHE